MHVAAADVARQRDVGQFQAVAATLAVGHQAHAGARHDHRHGMVGIGDQQHGRAARLDRDDLPEQAAGIDHALPHLHAIAAAGIEHQALARRIQVDVEDRRQLHVQPAALAGAEQAAQSRVLGGRRLQARQARAADQQRIAQDPVFRGEGAQARVVAQVLAEASR